MDDDNNDDNDEDEDDDNNEDDDQYIFFYFGQWSIWAVDQGTNCQSLHGKKHNNHNLNM